MLFRSGVRQKSCAVKHRLAEKQNIRNMWCEEKGCKIIACFGIVDDRVTRWCGRAGYERSDKEDLRKDEDCETRVISGLYCAVVFRALMNRGGRFEDGLFA